MAVVKLPYPVTRRVFARRPRKSKNGTPEECAAKSAAAALSPAKKDRRATILAFARRMPDPQQVKEA